MNRIEINLKTFIVGFLFFFGIFLAYQLRSIILIFFVAFIIFSTLKPIIDALDRRGVKRGLAIAIVYLLSITMFFLLLFLIMDGVVTQVREIATNLSTKQLNIAEFINTNLPFLKNFVNVDLIDKNINYSLNPTAIKSLTSGEAFNGIIESISPVATQGLSVVAKFAGGLVTIFMIIFLSLYMVGPRKDFYEEGLKMVPKKYGVKVNELLDKVRVKLGAWALGQLFLMVVIGLLTYIIIAIPGFFIQDYGIGKYALIIAILAGFLEGVPNVGPFLTLLIAVFFAAATGGSLVLVIYIIVMFILLQQAEGLFLVPVVMRKAIDLNPIISILAVLAGFELAGPLGALLSVPVVGILQIIIVDALAVWRNKND